jgi:succinoglycan biosynthesis transport protein ExoP
MILLATWIAIVAVSSAVCALVAFVATSQRPLAYVSEASLLIGPPLNGPINESDINVGQLLRGTYADLATTRPLLARVIADTGTSLTAEDLAGVVSARVPANSTLLVVSVTTSNANQAAQLANALASELVNYPTTLALPKVGATSGNNVTVSVVDPAIPATSAQDRHILLGTAAGGGVGLLIATGFAFLVENLRRERRVAVAEA